MNSKQTLFWEPVSAKTIKTKEMEKTWEPEEPVSKQLNERLQSNAVIRENLLHEKSQSN